MIEASLGVAVRELREGQQLSLRALAERTGFSASFLSQVENGQASPSISSMERIATALGVTMVEFFRRAGGDVPVVTRADARPTLQSEWSKARIEIVGGGNQHGRLEAMLVTLEAGGSSGKRPEASTREEFTLVLDGSLELTLDDGQQILEAGDAVTILRGAARRWHNPGDQVARILIVAGR